MFKKGFVYLFGDRSNEGVYKIGSTRGSVEKRIKQLQTGNGGEIYLISKHETNYPFFIERKLHNRYKIDNLLNEWYELPFSEIKMFNDICNEEERIIESLKDNPFFIKELK